jgi:oxygen-independent coproporphyrinogen-3 oxidase
MTSSAPLGLYVHIPFCSAICHYCDFAKTANYSDDNVDQYFYHLERQLLEWKRFLSPAQKFSSVFFGGGTPGLFTHQYDRLMALVRDMSLAEAEISLEANPDNVTEEAISIWRGLGFNRLSMGVQTFDPRGLKDLTRTHSSKAARTALELAAQYFPKSNGDLIYGWAGQDTDSWLSDLRQLVSTGVNHVSLYALTYEGQTPFARAERRGIRAQVQDDVLAHYYDLACEILEAAKFNHEEVSNWSKLGSSCDHNWLYWRGHHYVGIGAGAHGFVDDQSTIGLRYSYPSNFRELARRNDAESFNHLVRPHDLIKTFGGQIDASRDLESWKLEYVGCGLRCKDGIDLGPLLRQGFEFKPNSKVQRAISEGLMTLRAGLLSLASKEWFRETSWAYEVCESITRPNTNEP